MTCCSTCRSRRGQPVELRDHQHRHHAEQGPRVEPRAPRCSTAGTTRSELERGLQRLAQHERADQHHAVRRRGRSKILAGGIAGGVGTTIQVLQPGRAGQLLLRVRAQPGGREADLPGRQRRAGRRPPNGTINEQDLYVDHNGDGIINQDDLRPFHSPAPKWILGHSSYLAWGNLDLSFTCGRIWELRLQQRGVGQRRLPGAARRRRPYNLHASVLETGFATPQFQSDLYVEDASFLRMDNITLGYTFNSRAASRPGSSARCRTCSPSPATAASIRPPTSRRRQHVVANGIDNNIYPRSRTFIGGLSLSL